MPIPAPAPIHPPASLAELAETVRSAHSTRTPLPPLDLSRLSRLIRYNPEDMTVAAEAGMTLATLQNHLRPACQWIPIDPPFADSLSLHDLLAWDRSGPRRLGFGAIRDHVIGITVVPGDGRPYRSGGQVVKNVAGFDLMKLVIGAQGTLGIIADITFKVLPIPERESFLVFRHSDPPRIEQTLRHLAQLPVTPSVLDLFRVQPHRDPAWTLCLGFSGAQEDVDWQVETVAPLGFLPAQPPSHDEQFHSLCPPHSTGRTSVLPSKLVDVCAQFPPSIPFIARAGIGAILHPKDSPPKGFASPKTDPALLPVLDRLKREFDPALLFPPIPI